MFLQADHLKPKEPVSSENDLTPTKIPHHQETIIPAKNHSKLPKSGKKKLAFVPKAILKKGDQISSPPQITSTNKEPKSAGSGGGKLLEILARKNSQLNSKLNSPSDMEKDQNVGEASIEEELSGKICALLGITPK